MTPRGSPVEPDVYCRNASASAEFPRGDDSGVAPANDSASRQRTLTNVGDAAMYASRRGCNAADTIATSAPQSATLLATRPSGRRGFGGDAGPQITPAIWQANSVAT